jgi:hypothetical protein
VDAAFAASFPVSRHCNAARSCVLTAARRTRVHAPRAPGAVQWRVALLRRAQPGRVLHARGQTLPLLLQGPPSSARLQDRLSEEDAQQAPLYDVERSEARVCACVCVCRSEGGAPAAARSGSTRSRADDVSLSVVPLFALVCVRLPRSWLFSRRWSFFSKKLGVRFLATLVRHRHLCRVWSVHAQARYAAPWARACSYLKSRTHAGHNQIP